MRGRRTSYRRLIIGVHHLAIVEEQSLNIIFSNMYISAKLRDPSSTTQPESDLGVVKQLSITIVSGSSCSTTGYNSKRLVTVDTAIRIDCFPAGVHHITRYAQLPLAKHTFLGNARPRAIDTP